MFNRTEWLSIQASLGTMMVKAHLHTLTLDERKEVMAMMQRGVQMTNDDDVGIAKDILFGALRKVDSKLKEIQDGANEQAA